MALSGTTALVGAIGNDDAGSTSGSAYLYDFSDPCNITETKLTASDAAAGDLFGISVALSGATALVGAYLDDDAGDNSGSAYLFRPPVMAAERTLFVDADASGADDGSSWADAFNYLQDALAVAQDGNDIWVAAGTYKPDANSADPNGSGDRNATFALINGVGIYGGFAGGETSLDERDWQTNETILSGDLDGNDVGFTNNGENSYHVVTGSNTDANAVLDGFTITAGNANGSWPNNAGAGMFTSSGSPTVTNCTFSGNSAYKGGGMYNDNSSPMLTNCTFSGNSAVNSGGGMYNFGSSPTVTNCILWGDSASLGGAEIHNVSSTPTVTYSDVAGGYTGTGNINADPLFVDASNPDPSLRDYHLWPGSPCIDAGDNNSIPADTADLDNDGNTAEPIPYDIDTDVRVSGGTVDMGSDEAIWASAADVNQGETVILNPGGGGTDPNTEALVVFENLSGPNDATIEVTEVGTNLYPDGLFRALGRTIRIDTSLADGEFFITVSIPFDANDLAGEDPFGVDLLYWEQPPGKWRHAVRANTQGQESNPKKDRYQERYPPDAAPTLADLKARGLGANGVFWNSETQQGFVWANVDHTTDFEGLAHNLADFEPDGDVDFVDFAWFAPNWLDTACGVCGGSDLTGNGDVDGYDLQEFANNWLAGVSN